MALCQLGCLSSGSLPLFPGDTNWIVQGRSSIPHCSARGAFAGTETQVYLGRSPCTACTPSWHMEKGTSAAYLGMNACIACTIPGLRVSGACLERSTCTTCTPSQLGGDKHYLPGTEHLHCLHSFPAGGTNADCLGTNITCLGLSACPSCIPSLLGGSAGWACTVT